MSSINYIVLHPPPVAFRVLFYSGRAYWTWRTWLFTTVPLREYLDSGMGQLPTKASREQLGCSYKTYFTMGGGVGPSMNCFVVETTL